MAGLAENAAALIGVVATGIGVIATNSTAACAARVVWVAAGIDAAATGIVDVAARVAAAATRVASLQHRSGLPQQGSLKLQQGSGLPQHGSELPQHGSAAPGQPAPQGLLIQGGGSSAARTNVEPSRVTTTSDKRVRIIAKTPALAHFEPGPRIGYRGSFQERIRRRDALRNWVPRIGPGRT